MYLGKSPKGGAHLIIVRGVVILFGTFADFALDMLYLMANVTLKSRKLS